MIFSTFIAKNVVFFVQESAAELTPFILCKNSFSNIFFFTDMVSDMAVRYTLCAHCMSYIGTRFDDFVEN
jgi:hypothetical protein